MLDVVVRGGTIVDGTGRPAVSGDVGMRDGRIVAVGRVDEDARETIDAGGLVVAPGFVDLHAHYDAQIFWDPWCSPSPLHGVTSVVAGNCGLTLAPAAPDDRDFLTRLLARVEAIPVEALRAGVTYEWETYPQFLDVVEGRPLGVNIGFLVGHSALRRAVMGEDASTRAARPEELEAMCRLLDEALAAGGMGLSTANVLTQVDGDGRPTPPNFATHEELVSLAAVCGRHAGTSIEFIPGSFLVGFTDDDVELMTAMSAAANRVVNWNTPLVNKAAPELYVRQLRSSDHAAEHGGRVVALYMCQNGPTQQDFHDGYVWRTLPDWAFLFALSADERVAALRDPAVRDRLRAGLDSVDRGLAVSIRTSWGLHVVNEAPPALAHLNGRRISDIAAERGTSEFDAVCDIAADADLQVGFVRYSHTHGDEWSEGARRSLLHDDRVLLGASDAGAHMDMMVGADFTTRSFGDLVRGKGIFGVEEMVRRFSDEPARLYGLRDRGRLAVGAHADVVVFDPATIDAGPLTTKRDLPGGASRLTTDSVGVHWTLVGGRPVVAEGKLTAETPGQLMRSGRDVDTVTARPN
jgi:N-acyl-D-aspartate/D-glutamate deacylase